VRRRWLVVAACVLAGCNGTPTANDIDGARRCPLSVAPGAVHVLVFTSHECPIANSYAPTLRELASGWRDAPVQLFLVHVDPQLTPAAARQHATDYELPGTILLDPHHDLARAAGITKTPEAVVYTSAGLVYRGRIDDQWQALGSRSPAASRQDLRLAVAGALAGQSVPGPFPPAVGCLLPEPAPR